MPKTMVPQETTLYRRVAKDYNPKKAEMMICEYIEGLEARIVALGALNESLEARIAALENANAAAAMASEKKARKAASEEKKGE